MDMAISHLGNVVEIVASLTPKDLQVGPDFPIDFSPRDSIGFPNEGDKFLKIPGSVDNVLSSNLSVIIDIGFSLGAVKHFPLAHRE